MKTLFFGKLYNPDTARFISVEVLRAAGKSHFFVDGAPIDFKDLPLAGDYIQVTLPKELIARMNVHLEDCESKRYSRAIFASPAIMEAAPIFPADKSEAKRSKAKNRSSARVKFFLFDYALEMVRQRKNQSEFIKFAIELALLNRE